MKRFRWPVLLLVVAGCASAASVPPGAPAPEPALLADSLRAATVPSGPQRVAFSWELSEQGNRVRGQGVARVEAPRRARVDLFGPRGESYLSAVLVGDSLRLPGGLPPGVALPSPALLWGALGVVHPPADARLASAARRPGGAVLRYTDSVGSAFEFTTDTAGLKEVRRSVNGDRVESVVLSRDRGGELRRAEYRDWRAFRSLILSSDSITHASGFPEEIWFP